MKLKAKNNRKWIVMIILLAIITIPQFFNKPLEGKPVTEKINVPENVMLVLQKSCFSCHSNEQHLSWIEKMAPVSWIVNKDIYRAREVMNFSEWDNIPMVHEGRMYAILNMLQSEKMPLPEYALFHPSATVTPKDIATVKAYTLGLPRKSQTKINLSENENIAMPAKVSTPLKHPMSPNGIAYIEDFKKWKVISLTTLFDHSVRVVYGNDIAVKAIEEENFHPWPDGSIVVKSVWKELIMPNGEIRTGDFINAQFMVKDAQRFKETEGWGFAKFSGNNLIPTGTSPLFAQQSCISCHRQLAEKTGYLFNIPMKVNDSTIIKHLLR